MTKRSREAEAAITSYLSEHAENISEDATSAIRSAVPEYALLTPEQPPLVTLSELTAAFMSSGEGLDDNGREMAEAAGERRAVEGGSLEAATSAVRAATSVGIRWLHHAAGHVGPGAELAAGDLTAALERLTCGLVEFLYDVLGAVETGFLSYDLGPSQGRVAAGDAFLRRLLERPGQQPDQTLTEAAAFGIDLSTPLALAGLTDALAPGPRLFWDAVEQTAASLPLPALRPVPGPVGGGQANTATVLVPSWAPGDAAALREALVVACAEFRLVGVLDVVEHVEEVPVAFGAAQRGLVVAPVAAQILGAVMPVAQVLPYAGVDSFDPPAQARLLTTTGVASILGDPRGAEGLWTTLTAIVVGGVRSVAALARHLGVSEKTLRDRLDRIEQHTGLVVRSDDYAEVPFSLRSAVELYQLLGPTYPPLGDPAWLSPTLASVLAPEAEEPPPNG